MILSLCLALGVPSPRELFSRLTSSEVTQWLAFYSLDPWDGVRGDLRAGIVASTIANANRGKDQKAFVPDDFMPDFDREPTPKNSTVEQQRAVVNAIRAQLGDTAPMASSKDDSEEKRRG